MRMSITLYPPSSSSASLGTRSHTEALSPMLPSTVIIHNTVTPARYVIPGPSRSEDIGYDIFLAVGCGLIPDFISFSCRTGALNR